MGAAGGFVDAGGVRLPPAAWGCDAVVGVGGGGGVGMAGAVVKAGGAGMAVGVGILGGGGGVKWGDLGSYSFSSSLSVKGLDGEYSSKSPGAGA